MVKIFSDSTCDLTKELIEQYDITIIPLHIVMGDKEYRDMDEITPDKIYAWSDKNKTTPKTSAVSVEDVISALKPITKSQGEAVIFTISAEMSTTANVIRLTVEDLEAEDRIKIIDSRNLSTGVGHLVVEAAIMAKEGKSLEEIESHIASLVDRVRSSFVVDTLTYLARGGRCNSATALAGTVLKLHPKIVVENGKMDVSKKYRGKLSVVIDNYVKDLNRELLSAKKDRVFITHSGCDDSIVSAVREYLESLNHFNEIHVTRAGGVISSHCGPGTLGVLFISETNNSLT